MTTPEEQQFVAMGSSTTVLTPGTQVVFKSSPPIRRRSLVRLPGCYCCRLALSPQLFRVRRRPCSPETPTSFIPFPYTDPNLICYWALLGWHYLDPSSTTAYEDGTTYLKQS